MVTVLLAGCLPLRPLSLADRPGEGTPVLFVHGLGADREVWPHFVGRSLAVDLAGHGASPWRPAYSVRAHASDVLAAMDARGVDRVVLVAHSLGGLVAVELAAAHPERVAGLVLVDAAGDLTSVPVEERRRIAAREAAFTADDWRADWSAMLGGAWASTRAKVLDALRWTDVRAVRAMRAEALEYPTRARISKYGGPVAFIEADGPEAPEFRASAMVPGARPVTLRGVSHWLMLDDPEAFDAALQGALVEMRRSSPVVRQGIR